MSAAWSPKQPFAKLRQGSRSEKNGPKTPGSRRTQWRMCNRRHMMNRVSIGRGKKKKKKKKKKRAKEKKKKANKAVGMNPYHLVVRHPRKGGASGGGGNREPLAHRVRHAKSQYSLPIQRTPPKAGGLISRKKR